MDKRKCSDFADSLNNLSSRLGTNTNFGDNDLSTWVVNHLDIKPGERILDIGCGEGIHLIKIASIVKKNNFCFGIDYDIQMVKKAKDRSKNVNPKIIFRQMDMDTVGNNNSPFKNESLDLIYSVYAFYYSKNESKALDSFKKKLKKDGRIAIVGPYKDNNKQWFDFLGQFMKLPSSVLDANTTFMQRVKKYADKNFDVVDTAEFLNNITLPSYQALEEYWTSNIYYDLKHDQDFKKYAKKHFDKNKTFNFFKKAQMITMRYKLR